MSTKHPSPWSSKLTAMVISLAIGAQAATNSVTSLANTGPGSWPEVIAEATAWDTIVFGVSGTIMLASAGNLTVRGCVVAGNFAGNWPGGWRLCE